MILLLLRPTNEMYDFSNGKSVKCQNHSNDLSLNSNERWLENNFYINFINFNGKNFIFPNRI